jgi:rubrerythrin
MSLVRSIWTTMARPPTVAILALLGLVLSLALAPGAPAARARHALPSDPTPGWTQTRDAPRIMDTPENLQMAFTNELNARQRYLAYAARAEAEKYPAVARLFRACAAAESIHARRDVQAIAMTGQPARAVLERVWCGTTDENLLAAIGSERYEAEVWYPALLERARSDRRPMAVRSLALALGTEREHVRLLEDARARLAQRPVAVVLYVCPYCGRTTDAPEYRKCPGCFTSAARFLRPA